MGKLRKALTTPLPDAFRYLPGGEYLRALFYLVGFLGLNYVFVRSLWTGKMLGRYVTGWVEGRDSAPILYTIYILGIGLPTLMIDIYVILRLKGLVRRG